jgi:hypothetical protein
MYLAGFAEQSSSDLSKIPHSIGLLSATGNIGVASECPINAMIGGEFFEMNGACLEVDAEHTQMDTKSQIKIMYKDSGQII